MLPDSWFDRFPLLFSIFVGIFFRQSFDDFRDEKDDLQRNGINDSFPPFLGALFQNIQFHAFAD